MDSNQLITNEEIKDVHVNKVLNISSIAKTNSYKDLKDIPNEFTPEEHSHKLVTRNNAGLMTNTNKSKLDNAVGFTTMRVNYTVEEQDSNKGYKNINVDIDITQGKLISGNMIEFEGDELRKIIKIIGTSLDPNIYKPIKGDKGDIGDKGDTGFWWCPSVDEDGFITWTLKNHSENNGFTLFIKGPDGDKGITGFDGKNAFFDDVISNPFNENYTTRLKGSMFRFLNVNDSNNIQFGENLIILDSDCIIAFKKFQVSRYSKIYGNKFKFIYCAENNQFYEWSDTYNMYVATAKYSFGNIFRLNCFVYDVFLDNFLYIQSNRRFIGA